MGLLLRGCWALVLAVGVAGCTSGTYTPPDETGPWGEARSLRKENLYARSDFSLEVVRLTDARRPRSLERGADEQFMDTYDPETLLNGLTVRLPALYEKYLAYKPKAAKHYKVELELKELRTEVLNGDFWHGPFGRYFVKMEIEATARRPDSQVVLRRGYRFEQTQKRPTYNGRSPSVSMDEARLTDLVDAAVRTTAANFAYDMKQNDAARWQPARELAPVPVSKVRLLPQPNLTRATGSTAVGGSELVAPTRVAPVAPVVQPRPVATPRYAPDSVPPATLPTQVTW